MRPLASTTLGTHNATKSLNIFSFQVHGCGNPGNIPNGRFSGRDFSIGSRVVYRCSTGYKMKGKSSRKCKTSGKWTRRPVCLRARGKNSFTWLSIQRFVSSSLDRSVGLGFYSLIVASEVFHYMFQMGVNQSFGS